MKIKCLHGFFIFEETRIGQASEFMGYTGLSLVPWRDRYTFEFLEETPNYSIQGKSYLGFTALKTFAGEPWEVFAANGLVYDFSNDLVRPIETITTITQVRLAGDRFTSPGFILPGSITDDGKRVKDYAAFFSRETLRFQYTEVTYV